jgi:molecular chaperone DnaJ
VKKGVNAGDLMVTVEVQVPQRLDGKAKHALEEFAQATKNDNPRTDFFSRARS